MKEASHRYGGEVAFCGNMDPVALMLQGNTDQIYHATQKCILDGGNNCISAAGCEIPDGTPDENLKAQYRALVEV